jgi:enoyl-CoA hydratase
MSFVLIDKPRPHITTITLDRPERMNAMSFDVVEPLYAAIDRVAKDNDTSVVVLTGRGNGFCAGLDLEDHGVPPNCDGLPMSRIATRAMAYMSNLVPALRQMPQPVICAINGPAVGGGMCLTLGADIRIAAESAYFRAAGITNGLTATELGVSFLLPRLIGASHAFEILLSGRDVSAQEAARIGLVSKTVPDAALMDEVFALAEKIRGHSAHGVAMTKETIWANLETGSLEAAIHLENRNQLLVRLTTQNLEEAIRARREKRTPNYKD